MNVQPSDEVTRSLFHYNQLKERTASLERLRPSSSSSLSSHHQHPNPSLSPSLSHPHPHSHSHSTTNQLAFRFPSFRDRFEDAAEHALKDITHGYRYIPKQSARFIPNPSLMPPPEIENGRERERERGNMKGERDKPRVRYLKENGKERERAYKRPQPAGTSRPSSSPSHSASPSLARPSSRSTRPRSVVRNEEKSVAALRRERLRREKEEEAERERKEKREMIREREREKERKRVGKLATKEQQGAKQPEKRERAWNGRFAVEDVPLHTRNKLKGGFAAWDEPPPPLPPVPEPKEERERREREKKRKTARKIAKRVAARHRGRKGQSVRRGREREGERDVKDDLASTSLSRTPISPHHTTTRPPQTPTHPHPLSPSPSPSPSPFPIPTASPSPFPIPTSSPTPAPALPLPSSQTEGLNSTIAALVASEVSRQAQHEVSTLRRKQEEAEWRAKELEKRIEEERERALREREERKHPNAYLFEAKQQLEAFQQSFLPFLEKANESLSGFQKRAGNFSILNSRLLSSLSHSMGDQIAGNADALADMLLDDLLEETVLLLSEEEEREREREEMGSKEEVLTKALSVLDTYERERNQIGYTHTHPSTFSTSLPSRPSPPPPPSRPLHSTSSLSPRNEYKHNQNARANAEQMGQIYPMSRDLGVQPLPPSSHFSYEHSHPRAVPQSLMDLDVLSYKDQEEVKEEEGELFENDSSLNELREREAELMGQLWLEEGEKGVVLHNAQEREREKEKRDRENVTINSSSSPLSLQLLASRPHPLSPLLDNAASMGFFASIQKETFERQKRITRLNEPLFRAVGLAGADLTEA